MRGQDSGSEREHDRAPAHREPDAGGSVTPPADGGTDGFIRQGAVVPPSFGRAPASAAPAGNPEPPGAPAQHRTPAAPIPDRPYPDNAPPDHPASDDTAWFRVPNPADFPSWPPRLPGEPHGSNAPWPGTSATAASRPFGPPWPPPGVRGGDDQGRHRTWEGVGPPHAPTTPPAADARAGGMSVPTASQQAPGTPATEDASSGPDSHPVPGGPRAPHTPASPDATSATAPGATGSAAPGAATASGSVPFAFTPVTPAGSGKPTPPPGFGPAPSFPATQPLPRPGGQEEPDSPAGTGAQTGTVAGAVRKTLLIATSIAAVGAIGAAAYFAYADQPHGNRGASTATTAPATGTPDTGAATAFPQQTGPASAILDSETTDPRKMTLAEAFPDTKITLAGRTYRRVKVDATDKCEQAATGVFANALELHQCRRVLRATYVDSKRVYAVTAGIAVMPSKDAALAVDQIKDLGNNVWFRGLNGSAASKADRVAISGGYAAGMVWGRYLVFSYATYTDGHTPDAKDKTLGPISGAFRDHTAKVIEKRATG